MAIHLLLEFFISFVFFKIIQDFAGTAFTKLSRSYNLPALISWITEIGELGDLQLPVFNEFED